MSPGSMTALIVEDHALFRQVFREALESGFPDVVVVEAEDMTEGLRMAELHSPDVAFVSLPLRDGDGVELAEFLRRELPACKLGLCGIHDLPEYREAARAQGAAFFHKGDIDAESVARFVRGGS